MADFGSLADAGSLVLDGAAQAAASGVSLSGFLTLGGTSSLAVGALLDQQAGSRQIGADAALDATAAWLFASTSIAGMLEASASVTVNGPLTLAGGAIDAPDLQASTGATLAGYGALDVHNHGADAAARERDQRRRDADQIHPIRRGKILHSGGETGRGVDGEQRIPALKSDCRAAQPSGNFQRRTGRHGDHSPRGCPARAILTAAIAGRWTRRPGGAVRRPKCSRRW